MPYYEYMVITRQNFLQDNRPDDLIKKMSNMLNNQGQIIRHEYWGLCNFNYVIKRKRRGHYVLLYIDTNAEVIAEIQKKMSIDDNILRYLVTKIDSIPKYISPLVQDYEKEESVSTDQKTADEEESEDVVVDELIGGDVSVNDLEIE